MSDTPRTDAVEITMVRGHYSDGEPDEVLVVESHHMAEIEQELNQANAQIVALRGVIQDILDSGDNQSNEVSASVMLSAKQALSSPAPAVVPSSQLTELRADAETLALKAQSALEFLPSEGDLKDCASTNNGAACPLCRSAQKLRESLSAFRAKHPAKGGADEQ